MPKALSAICLAMLVAACQPAQSDALSASDTAAPPPPHLDAGSDEMLGFAQAACGGCHAVEAGWQSPNPHSPTFADIANRHGLTQQSLATWLRDAHNYPEEMDFDLTREQVDALAAHMMTLKDKGYQPPVY